MGIQKYRSFPVNFPGYLAGNWYMPALGLAPATGAAMALNVIRFHPFWVYHTCTISDVGLRTTTAGGNAQIAIYRSDPATKAPTGNALSSTSSIDVSGAAGIKTAALAASVQLTPGLYWMAVNSDNSSLVCVVSASTLFTGMIGLSAATNLYNASTSYFAHTFATTYGTWPDMTGATLGAGTTNAWALVIFKVASVP